MSFLARKLSMHRSPRRCASRFIARAAASAAVVLLPAGAALAQNYSSPAILQWFEGKYTTIEYRAADFWTAGYGGMWTPPPGRADAGNLSVGYDQYDRFDLGSNGNPTLYGTETGIKSMISEVHKVGGRSYLDLVWNHNGFSDWSNVDGSGHSFLNAGGYPGFYMSTGNGNWGDFHDPAAGGDENMQLSGLIDIDQSTNSQFIRNPVGPNPQNLPGGTQSAYGRIANVPAEANRRFYQDRSLTGLNVVDPITGNSTLYNYGPTSATNGTPVTENATGYLMRNARWLIQDTGADGFRLDASKNYPDWVLPYLDKAVYKAIQTPLLDGKQQHVWSFGETFDSNWGVLQSRTRLDIKSKPDNEVGGNRDSLDFSLYYAMQQNLSGSGLQNDWRNVNESSFDGNDGFGNNGSQGVAFVQSHDSSGPPPYLSNVAYAYTLLRPGQAVVYYNAHEFGTGRAFPNPGRDDALGGPAANNKYITTLVDIRNRYGIGNYTPRIASKEILAYERDRSVVVALSNRLDNGSDAVTVQTGFRPGQPLIELTGNAADTTVDPNDQIPSLVIVNADGTINFRVPRNKNINGVEHGRGYVMYGLSGPQGSLAITSPQPITTLGPDAGAGSSATARITPVKVIKSNTFTATLNTNAVTLLGIQRDADADGDNALIKVDGGLDINGNGDVDFKNSEVADANGGTRPNLTTYGYENFLTTHTPGYGSPTGNGVYAQDINAANLSEGYHYIEVRAFRHRDAAIEGANVPATYSSFKEVVYIDRLPPAVAAAGTTNKPGGSINDKRFSIQSTDKTANSVYVLLDQPATRTDAQILASLSGNGATQTDRDIWARDVNSVSTGNHVLTVVAYEITGNYSITRIPGQFVQTAFGVGLGDMDRNNSYSATDVSLFTPVLKSNNSQFNATGDFNADGLIDLTDAFLYGPTLSNAGASQATYNAYLSMLADPYVTGGSWTVTGSKTVNEVTAGSTVLASGATLSAKSISGNSLTIPAGASITVRANGTGSGMMHIGAMSINPTGKLDLKDNDLIVEAMSYSTVRQMVLDGFGQTTGLTSSSSDGSQILALFDNALIGAGDWNGATIGANAIVGKYTYFGDANFDGQVTGDDYTIVDSNLNSTPPVGLEWLSGDVNLDGLVTGDDYTTIDSNLGLGLGNPLSANALRPSALGASPVPEPASVLLMGALGAAGLLARRRRHSSTCSG